MKLKDLVGLFRKTHHVASFAPSRSITSEWGTTKFVELGRYAGPQTPMISFFEVLI
jgi:hypothetical protein